MSTVADHIGFDAYGSLPSRREVVGWLGAGLVVVAMHALAAEVFHRMQAPGEPMAGQEAAMVVDFAPVPFMAPATVANDILPEQLAPEVADAVEGVETLGEEGENTTTEQNVAETVAETPVDKEQVSEVAPEVAEPEPIETQLVEQVTPEVAIPVPTLRPKAEPENVVEKPKTVPVRKADKPKPAERIAERQKVQRSQAATAPAPLAAAAPSVSPAKWQAKVVAWINRHKPRSVRGRGELLLKFSIDADGNVLAVNVARSSGNDTLDQAAIKTVMRSSPVPPPPPEADRRLLLPMGFR